MGIRLCKRCKKDFFSLSGNNFYCSECIPLQKRDWHRKGYLREREQGKIVDRCPKCEGFKSKRARLCRVCHLKYRERGQPVGYRTGTMGGGYIGIKIPDHPRASKSGYVLEHIYVWEMANGRPVPDGWIIHHLNGKKADNRKENLIAMPKSQHKADFKLRAAQKRIRDLEEAMCQLKLN